MSYTETTSTSWFARLRNALIGIVIGFILLIGCIWLLIWNEGRAIGTYRALVEGAAMVVSVDSATVDPANDGKLVHISGAVKPDEVPTDSDYGIAADKAVGLSRQVEMYQWVEKSESTSEKKLGGSEETTTTYSYSKEWRSDVVDSSNFKKPDGHENPDRMPDSATFTTKTADVGAFSVPGQTLADIGDQSEIALTDADVANIAAQLGSGEPVTRSARSAYVGQNAKAPQVGDMKITFQRIDIKEASLVGKQSHTALVPYETANHREIFLSESGDVAADQMFKTAQSENTIITWLVRVGGLVGIFIGFTLMFSILPVIGDVIPFIGSIIGFGTGLVAFLLTLIIGPVVIAIGWFAYRPLLSLGIIAGGVVLAFIVLRLRRKAPAPAAAAQ